MSTLFSQLAQQLWSPAKSFIQQGLTYQEYLNELTWLMFLKLTATDFPIATRVVKANNWHQLLQKNGWAQLADYTEILTDLSQIENILIKSLFQQAETSLSRPEQLTQLLSVLEHLDLLTVHEWGAVYENVIEKYASLDDNSLYLIPPQALIDVMVIVTQPQKTEIIQDPLAGVGSFLVAAEAYRQVINDDETVNYQPLMGMEQDLTRQRWATMNCLLHNLTSPTVVQWGDSLLIDDLPQADVIFSTLVFAKEPNEAAYKLNTPLALLKHIYRHLKPGGRAAVIVPDTVLKSAGPAQKLRQELMNSCRLHTVLRLPLGIFAPHVVAAHVLFFYRPSQPPKTTDHIWFYDLRTHFNNIGYYRRLKRETLLDFQSSYGEAPYGESVRQPGQRWQSFSRDQLIADNLDHCWLQSPQEQAEEEEETQELWDVLNVTVQELEELSWLLNGGPGQA